MKHLPKNFQGKCSATQSPCAQEVNLFNSTNRQSIKKNTSSHILNRETHQFPFFKRHFLQPKKKKK